MTADRSQSVHEFEARCPDDEACERGLMARRGRAAFAAQLAATIAPPWRGAGRVRPVAPVDLGDRRHGGLVATHRNGISAQQLSLSVSESWSGYARSSTIPRWSGVDGGARAATLDPRPLRQRQTMGRLTS
jgi:hypothetical protein